jgi:hypothetical protein
MNWEAIGAISEVIGAIGVLITLTYLAIQIRSQNQSMRIQNMRSRASESGSVFALQATPETMESAIVKAYATGEELNVAEQHAVESYVSIFLLSAECDYRIYKEGLMPLEDWAPIRNQIKLVFSANAPKAWWNNITKKSSLRHFRQKLMPLSLK